MAAGKAVPWEGQGPGRRLSFSEKIQGLEIGERNEGCSSIFSSLAIHCFEEITFLLHSLLT